VGIRGGMEAIVHAARAIVTSASPLHAFVKLDIRNSFNSVPRDSIFEAVMTCIPSIFSYIEIISWSFISL